MAVTREARPTAAKLRISNVVDDERLMQMKSEDLGPRASRDTRRRADSAAAHTWGRPALLATMLRVCLMMMMIHGIGRIRKMIPR